MNILKEIVKAALLFIIGGSLYVVFELFFRVHSHWTMLLVGGICFLAVGGINNWISWKIPIWLQGLMGMCIITAVEFISGLILNIWLGLGIWDYSGLPLNVLGQICVPFMGLWFLLSLVAIVLDDSLRYAFFGEEKPHYKLWF